jgi:hypothetical protein
MVDDALAKVTAKRLVLDICPGFNPKKVNAGVINNPPPTPINEPRMPAPKPIMTRTNGKNRSSNHGHASSLHVF